MSDKQYWLVTFEQDFGTFQTRDTTAYDIHPAEFLADWNDNLGEGKYHDRPLTLIFAMPITKEQYERYN